MLRTVLGIMCLAVIVSVMLTPRQRVHEVVPVDPPRTKLTWADVTEPVEPFAGHSKKAIALLMRRPIDLPLWLRHHREFGIGHFFIRLEDSPGWDDFLKTQPDITYEIAASDKTNNYETLQARQIEYVNRCIAHCPAKHINWLFHIDADELLDGSLAAIDALPPTVKTVRLQNVEAVFDGTENTCFAASHFLRCSAGAPCRSYANGKAGGRIEPGVSMVGPHHFAYKSAKHHPETANRDIPFKSLHVLHFDSCSFGSWAEKFQHLSKSPNHGAIPFPYYKESITAAAETYGLYKKHTMPDIESIDSALVYTRLPIT